ncbi:MAG: nucleotidyltransferase [Thermoprotei archaeon]
MRVSRDLKQVVFVGAFAVNCHVGMYRSTLDIDLALAVPLSDRKFEELGYHISYGGREKVIRTPEGVKLDVYTRDVSGIPVFEVFATAVTKRVRSHETRVMCLEALLVAKMRASRPQDIEDVQVLCQRLGKFIRWDLVNTLATPTESAELKNVVSAFS